MVLGKVSTETDLDQYVDSMAEAFREYPVIVRAFADAPGKREDWLRRMVRESAQARAAVGVATPVAFVNEMVVAGAALFVPGVEIPDDVRAWWPRLVAEAGPETGRFFERFIAAAESVELPQPNLYLAMIGVHPTVQGQGVGKALIEHVVEIARTLPGVVGVGLDTEVESNVTVYERCGFTVRGKRSVDELPVWVMFRDV